LISLARRELKVLSSEGVERGEKGGGSPLLAIKELKALSYESDERGEKRALLTTKEFRVVRKMKEDIKGVDHYCQQQ